MSYAVLTLCIVFMINMGLFLAGSPEVNSPMLGFTKALFTSDYNVDWSSLIPDSSSILTKLIMIGTITALVLVVSNMMNPTASLTGNFNTFHVMTVLAMAVFITFLAVPNFAAMGFPDMVSTVIQAVFGFMVVLSIFGLMKGGN